MDDFNRKRHAVYKLTYHVTLKDKAEEKTFLDE